MKQFLRNWWLPILVVVGAIVAVVAFIDAGPSAIERLSTWLADLGVQDSAARLLLAILIILVFVALVIFARFVTRWSGTHADEVRRPAERPTEPALAAARATYLDWRAEDVENRLRTSLHRAIFLDLDLAEQPGVTRPWTYRAFDPQAKLQTFRWFEEAFAHYRKRVLLLGEPGSGKTTTLLDMAKRLLREAKDSADALTPLLYNLSLWQDEDKDKPFADWLVKQTARLRGAGVSEAVAGTWVNDGRVILLLDGLDEVDAGRRAALVKAMNAYFSAHPTMTVIVCSRAAEYAALQADEETRLWLEGAVMLQPLARAQIDDYLTAANATALRDAIRGDAGLYDLAQTPLTLSMMTLAYAGLPADEIPADLPPMARRRHLFDAYIDRMMKRKAIRDHGGPEWHTEDPRPVPKDWYRYTREQVDRYLGWLGIRLGEQAVTEFPLDGIYRFLDASADERFWNTVNVTNAIMAFLFAFSFRFIVASLGMSRGEALLGLASASLTGLLVAAGTLGVRWAIRRWPEAETRIMWIGVLGIGLGVGLVGVLGVGLAGVLGGGLAGVVGVGLGVELVGGLGVGQGGVLIGVLISVLSAGLTGVLISVVGGGLGVALGVALVGVPGLMLIGVLCFVLGLRYRARLEHLEQEYIANPIARLLLSIVQRQIPFRFERFLKYNVEALLLKRAGNNFAFVHDLLRDHFALRELIPRIDPEQNDVKTRRLTVRRLARLGESAREALESVVAADPDPEVKSAAEVQLRGADFLVHDVDKFQHMTQDEMRSVLSTLPSEQLVRLYRQLEPLADQALYRSVRTTIEEIMQAWGVRSWL